MRTDPNQLDQRERVHKQTSFIKQVPSKSDVVYTPNLVAKQIIDFIKPRGTLLDPCRGDGAFFNLFPFGGEYCELTEEKDFFDFNKHVDWIIGNPPYSIFENFLKHSFYLADNVSFLVPTNKVFQRQKIMEMINDYGGIKSILIYGSGSVVDFPFGFSVGNFVFEKDYRGKTDIVMGIKKILSPAQNLCGERKNGNN